MRPLIVVLAFIAAAFILAGCQTTNRAASIRGACAAFDAPMQPVFGKRRVDQRTIDKWVEAGVSACGWSRPKAQAIVAGAAGR